MIEDTSFIIDLLRGDADARAFLDILEKENRPEKLASITVLELYEGLARSNPSEARRRKVLDVLETKHVIDADAAVMQRAGQLSGALITDGQWTDREDCVVAATALLHDEPVVTGNADHFERIDGLDVRTY
jgi:predicted nucleic acid-binding protein